MVNLVYENGKIGHLAYHHTQLIGHSQLATLVIGKKTWVFVIFIPSVQDDLLRIGDSHQSHHSSTLEMLINLKGVRVLDDIAFLGTFLFVKHLKLDESFQVCSSVRREKPRSLKVLDAPKARHDARLQARGSKNQKIVRPNRIERFYLGKI